MFLVGLSCSALQPASVKACRNVRELLHTVFVKCAASLTGCVLFSLLKCVILCDMNEKGGYLIHVTQEQEKRNGYLQVVDGRPRKGRGGLEEHLRAAISYAIWLRKRIGQTDRRSRPESCTKGK